MIRNNEGHYIDLPHFTEPKTVLIYEKVYPDIEERATDIFKSDFEYKRECLLLQVILWLFVEKILIGHDLKIVHEVFNLDNMNEAKEHLDIENNIFNSFYKFIKSKLPNIDSFDINEVQENVLNLLVKKFNVGVLNNQELIKKCLKNLAECYMLDENICMYMDCNEVFSFLSFLPPQMREMCEDLGDLILLGLGEDYRFMDVFSEEKKKSLLKIDGRILEFVSNPTKEDYINALKSRRTYDVAKLIPLSQYEDAELVETALTNDFSCFEIIPHKYINQDVVDHSFLNGIAYHDAPLEYIKDIPDKFHSIMIKNAIEYYEKEEKEIENRKRKNQQFRQNMIDNQIKKFRHL